MVGMAIAVRLKVLMIVVPIMVERQKKIEWQKSVVVQEEEAAVTGEVVVMVVVVVVEGVVVTEIMGEGVVAVNKVKVEAEEGGNREAMVGNPQEEGAFQLNYVKLDLLFYLTPAVVNPHQ